MANTNYGSIDDYIASQPESSRSVLEKVRSAMRKALPDAEEVISYQIPAFKVNGRITIYFAGWKEHYSVYPASAAMAAAFKDDLEPYEVNNKGTIRFPLTERVPAQLIGRLAKFRAKEVAEHYQAKATTKAKTKAASPKNS